MVVNGACALFKYEAQSCPIAGYIDDKSLLYFSAGIIANVAIPLIYHLGSRLISFLKSRPQLPESKIPIKIPNITELNDEALKYATQGSYIRYFVTSQKKIGVVLHCNAIKEEEIYPILEILLSHYPNLGEIQFEGLTYSPKRFESYLRSFKNLKTLSFRSCPMLQQRDLDYLMRKLPITGCKLYDMDHISRKSCSDWEDRLTVLYSDRSTNIDSQVQAFVIDMNKLGENPSREMIQEALEKAKKKPYFALFDSDALHLNLGNLRCCNDLFLSVLFDFFRRNNIQPKFLEMTNANVTGSFLEHGTGLLIQSINLTGCQLLNTQNLDALIRYPSLINLDLSNIPLTDEDLARLERLKLKSLIVLGTTLSLEGLAKSIEAMFPTLEYLCVVGNEGVTALFIGELLERANRSKPFIFVTVPEDVGAMFIKRCNGLSKGVINHLRRINYHITSLVFDDSSTLYVDDFENLLQCRNLYLRELDFSRNVRLEPYRKSDRKSVMQSQFITPIETHAHKSFGNQFRQAAYAIMMSRLRTRVHEHPLTLINDWPLTRMVLPNFDITIHRNAVIDINITTRGEENFSQVVAYLRGFRSINALSLSGSHHLSPDIIYKLAELTKEVRINTVDLSYTNLTNRDLQTLEETPKPYFRDLFENVRVINFDNNNLVPDTLFPTWKSPAMPDPSIRYGDIGSNPYVDLIISRERIIRIFRKSS